MTVGELRALLADLESDAPVLLPGFRGHSFSSAHALVQVRVRPADPEMLEGDDWVRLRQDELCQGAVDAVLLSASRSRT